jgi:hypothetical protein
MKVLINSPCFAKEVITALSTAVCVCVCLLSCYDGPVVSGFHLKYAPPPPPVAGGSGE